MLERDLFLAALDLENQGDRARFLAEQCVGDPAKLQRLQHLLLAKSAAGEFLEAPAAGLPEVEAVDATSTFSKPAATGTFRPGAEAAGTVVAGRYKLLQQIGEGGMGTVWMADQTEPVKRKVAVKLIRVEKGQSKTILARFEAERQAIALMDHPHIAKLLDAGTTDTGSPYFVMELVKGVPLNEFCDAHKLGIPERLALFMQICVAVQHAHQKGIIHRDLKPSNILVESHDGKPVPKVIDFGLAKATTGLQLSDHTLFTAFGSVIGTPLYMAPEQANFNAVDVDTRADVYALGVILYELLTGTTPLTRETVKKAALDEMLRLIREQEAPTPSSRLSSSESAPSVAANRQTEPAKLGRFVKGELDWIVLKALAKERNRRYETASGFARDVERFLNHEPVTAGPPGATYRLKKFVRRNRPQVVAASLVLLALVAGVVGTTAGLIRAEQQRQVAEHAAEQERVARNDAVGQQRLAERAAEQERQAKQREAERADGEKKAKEEAVRNLAFARKGNEILNSVFAGLHPNKIAESGRPLQDVLRENLVKAVKELEGSAIGDPVAVAEMQDTLGQSLGGLGAYELAIEVLQKARDTFKANFGPDDPRTTNSMNNLAKAYLDAGKLDLALPLFKETLKLTKAKLGPDHPDTLNSMYNLAKAYQQAGMLHLALPLLVEMQKLQKAKLGPDHPDTLNSMYNLAAAYQEAGKPDLALPLFEETLKHRKAKLGPDHPDSLNSMNNLATAYQDDGKLDLALPLFEETLKLRKAKLGPDHPHTLNSINNLAACYWRLKRLDRSIPLFEEVLRLQEKTLGRGHPDTVMTVANLGVNYKDAGLVADGVPLLEEAYRAAKTHAALRFVGPQLLDAYSRAGQPTAAAKLIDELLADARKTLPKDSPQFAGQLAAYGLTLLTMKGFAEAEPLLRESLAIRAAKEPDDRRTFNTHSMLGGALLGQKKYAEAEPLLVKGYEGMKAREKQIPPQGATRLPEALDRLIALYTATNKPDEARKYRDLRAKYPDVAPPPQEKK